MCILYFDRERARVVRSALYTAAVAHRQELEAIAIAASNTHRNYADAVAAVDRAEGAWAIKNALENLAEVTPSYPAWR